jgi:oxepin-CoA hydrolase/3-oxo-5,6-dehydrosuberyl-CoA semialdehyde dehydrogenase
MIKLRYDVDDSALRDSFLRAVFFGALDPLRPDHRPRWGRMTAQQMVEHLVWAFELSTGRAQVECSIPDDQLPRMKRFLYHNRPSPPEFMNPALRDGLPALRFPGIPDAAAALQVEVDRFLHHARTSPTAIHTHPVFGPIGIEDWSRTHFKHCAHHLQQFGLLEVEA